MISGILRRTLKMPLRARINPQILPSYSSSATTDSSADEILFGTNGVVRTATLNRPKKLNAINQNMCELMIPRLLEYSKSDLVGSIVVKGAGGKALSAGGDITFLALRSRDEGLEQAGDANATYFRVEFGLNHLIATYNKPYVSFWDGIVMGGGVGLTAHGSFRIATEKTLLASPETTIGYYPDVGQTFWLARQNGQLGLFAALTSYRFKGYDAYRYGLATHFVNSELLPQVEARLAELEAGAIELNEYYGLVDRSIAEFASEPPSGYKPDLSTADLEIIDSAFSHNTMEEILDSLNAQKEKSPKFVVAIVNTLNERCPLSLKVTLKLFRKFEDVDIRSSFEQEMTVCHHFCTNENFMEGVIALLVDRRAPKWVPAKLEDVTNEMVNKFFQPVSTQRPVKFENDKTFTLYPHQFGLPHEQAVMDFVTGETSEQETKVTRDDVYEHFRKRYPGGAKQGLQFYINELLDRKTTPDPEDSNLLDWNY